MRKQIRESFFNPILHILPLPIFIAVEEFYGILPAWMITLPVSLTLLGYVYLLYNRIFGWHIIFQTIGFITCLIASMGCLLPISAPLNHLFTELIVFLSISLVLKYRAEIQNMAVQMVARTIPMSNNFKEAKRLLNRFYLLLSSYLIINILIHCLDLHTHPIQNFTKETYLALLAALFLYELIRVQFIRFELLKEEWWPIVNEQGKIIGSIQHMTSMKDSQKFRHPIVRVMVIDRGMIMLQKRDENNMIFPGLWDTAISNHIKMNESIEQCIDRTAHERYNIKNFRYMFLSNYNIESANEIHYAFLFVSCQQIAYHLESEHGKQLKWWTQHQIEENLNSGIFSDNLKIEYDLLKRSGLLESGKCQCNCKLKEAITQQSKLVVKNLEEFSDTKATIK